MILFPPALSRLALGGAALLAACAALAGPTIVGSGQSRTEERAVSGYRGVALAIPGRVEVVQGDREGVTLAADDNLLPLIETVVEGGVLHIRFPRGHSVRARSDIRATVYARAVESLVISGSGDFVARSLDTARLAVRISGSGDVTVGGRAAQVEVGISGSGDVDARRLEAQRVSVRIAGSGDASVWARESLDVKVSGSGDVRYYGDPEVAKRIAGSGTVRRAGASPG